MVGISAFVAVESNVTSLNGLMPCAQGADHPVALLERLEEYRCVTGISCHEMNTRQTLRTLRRPNEGGHCMPLRLCLTNNLATGASGRAEYQNSHDVFPQNIAVIGATHTRAYNQACRQMAAVRVANSL